MCIHSMLQETGKETKRRISSKGRGGGYALSPSEGVVDNPNSNTIASTSNIDNALLLKLEEKIMKQVDSNHRQVMGKLSNIENLLRSSNMLGAPTINQKVKSLIGQVATLTQAMNDVTLLLEDKSNVYFVDAAENPLRHARFLEEPAFLPPAGRRAQSSDSQGRWDLFVWWKSDVPCMLSMPF